MNPFQLICLYFEENYRGWRQIISRGGSMEDAADSVVKHAQQMKSYCKEIGGPEFNEKCIACVISQFHSGTDFLKAYKNFKNGATKEIE